MYYFLKLILLHFRQYEKQKEKKDRINIDKKREISDDIPQENWQLAIVAIAHYLRRYDA
mgnify:CR=1 FL=1